MNAFWAFNRGLVSRLGLARVDVKRLALSAETFKNWIPRVLGSMSIRPGMKYLGSTKSDAAARFVPFVFAVDDTALLEFTNLAMRVWVSDALVTRAATSTVLANSSFTSAFSASDWVDADEGGSAVSYRNSGDNTMNLNGDGTNAAIRYQVATVGVSDLATEHAVRIVVSRGPVYVRIGSVVGLDDLLAEVALDTGTHSLAVTPTNAGICVYLFNRAETLVQVTSCAIESAGVMEITTPWTTANLGNIRTDQSGDIVFCACTGVQQRMIQRRSTRSWSVVLYKPNDGPFLTENAGPVTITASALTGNISLTASKSLFRSTHVGSLFSLTSDGQTITKSIPATATPNSFSDALRITGVGTSRIFTILFDGVWTATVKVQRSLTSDAGPWETLTTTYDYSYNNQSLPIDDGLDNQIAWYRAGVNTGTVTGTLGITLDYPLGSIRGVARVTFFSGTTIVGAEVLSAFGGTEATEIWAEGAWSDKRGFPSAVALHEGRLWWAGKSSVWGSVSDAFTTFDPDTVGDSGPIFRTIVKGPVDKINWLQSSQRLLIGGQGAEYATRSSSLDEPLTPTQFTVKVTSTQGSAAVSAVTIDSAALFANRTGMRVYESVMNLQKYDYESADLTQLVPEIGSPGIIRMAVQRQPDTRVHCVRSDGTVALLTFDKNEDVKCWSEITSVGNGTISGIEDVVVLPAESGDVDDRVYYVVKRTIYGQTKRYLERWAQTNTTLGAAVNNLADSYVTYAGTATTNITGLTHLEGERVTVWANGVDIGTSADGNSQNYTVSSGAVLITGSTGYTNVTVGLPYTADWESAKLGPTQQAVLGEIGRIQHVSLLLADAHAKGLRFGPDFTHLDDRPGRDDWADVSADNVDVSYDSDPIIFPGTWTPDMRICLRAQAPRPCTVLAVAYKGEKS